MDPEEATGRRATRKVGRNLDSHFAHAREEETPKLPKTQRSVPARMTPGARSLPARVVSGGASVASPSTLCSLTDRALNFQRSFIAIVFEGRPPGELNHPELLVSGGELVIPIVSQNSSSPKLPRARRAVNAAPRVSGELIRKKTSQTCLHETFPIPTTSVLNYL